MARRFFYTSLGLLCLIAAYQLGAGGARADWSPNVAGQIIGGDMSAANQSRWYTASGEAWKLSSSGWERGEWETRIDLPVPASQVKFLAGEPASIGFGIHLITMDDVAWTIFTVGPSNGEWQELGPLPAAPVAVEGESVGGVKGRYR
jgi:hypothetical protein